MRQALSLAVLLFALAGTASPALADVNEDITKIMADGRSGKLDEALETYNASLKENSDNLRLRGQAIQLWNYLNRANRHKDGVQLLGDNLSWSIENKQYAMVPTMVSRLGYSQGKVNATDKHLATLSGYAETLSSKETIQAVAAWSSISQVLAQASFVAKDEQKALSIYGPVVERARAVCAGKEEDVNHLSILSSVLSIHASLVSDTEASQTLRDESLAVLRTGIQDEIPRFEMLLLPYSNQISSQVRTMTRSGQIEAAQALLDELAAAADGLDDDNRYKANVARTLAGAKRTFAAGKVHYDLLGQKSVPLDVVSWVNGEELSDVALEGKVVLLDFWAVWCGPCIATFPHLREWNEKYSDKGLVIIGMTRHYKYGWNPETNRPSKDAEISPEDEEAAMVEFAAHHELSHRFGVMPAGSQFSKGYGVTGIPQAVVIDREGKIRMIKVGSGSANAHAIDELLKELLDDAT